MTARWRAVWQPHSIPADPCIRGSQLPGMGEALLLSKLTPGIRPLKPVAVVIHSDEGRLRPFNGTAEIELAFQDQNWPSPAHSAKFLTNLRLVRGIARL